MTASPPPTVNLRSTAFIENPAAPGQLDLLAESIHLAPSPAFFVIWQDGADSMGNFVDVLIRAGLTTPHVIRPENLEAKLTGLEQRASSLPEDAGVIFLGCLSALSEQGQKQFNSSRDRLLGLPTRLIFVESIADERRLRLGFPDVFSQVSYDCRLFRRDEPDPFATTNQTCQLSHDVESPSTGLLSGIIHEVRETVAICWLEIRPGLRVKFSVPLSLLTNLDPKPGLQLLWNPGKEEESPKFWKRDQEPAGADLIREVNERYQRIRENLKSWQPHVPEDD